MDVYVDRGYRRGNRYCRAEFNFQRRLLRSFSHKYPWQMYESMSCLTDQLLVNNRVFNFLVGRQYR